MFYQRSRCPPITDPINYTDPDNTISRCQRSRTTATNGIKQRHNRSRGAPVVKIDNLTIATTRNRSTARGDTPTRFAPPTRRAFDQFICFADLN